jgi:GNAT superfamily N-acetyltransferase
MSEILEDLSVPAMVTAIEDNLFTLFSSLWRFWPRAEMHDDPDMLWTITDIPFSLFNSVLHAQLTPDNLDDVIEAAKDRCKSRNVPMLWWTGPATRPLDLGIHLERQGFSHDEDMPGMAADLMKLNEGLPTPSGLIIEQVSNIETLKQWCHVVTVGFEFPEAVEKDFFDMLSSLGFAAELPILNYLGWLKGEPVATSTLVFGAGVAGIYDVATLPAARQQGIGAAITLFPLLKARRSGYRVGILQASAMGTSVYRGLGFQEYCKIGLYGWSGAPESQGAG